MHARTSVSSRCQCNKLELTGPWDNAGHDVVLHCTHLGAANWQSKFARTTCLNIRTVEHMPFSSAFVIMKVQAQWLSTFNQADSTGAPFHVLPASLTHQSVQAQDCQGTGNIQTEEHVMQ